MKRVVLFLFLVFLSFSVSAEMFYQETADSIVDATPGYWSPGELYDGNWDTGDDDDTPGAEIAVVLENYTINASYYDLIWGVRDLCGWVNISNVSSVGCFNDGVFRVNISSQYQSDGADYVRLYCHDGSDWVLLRSCDTFAVFYEDGVWWNDTAPPAPASPSVQDQTFLFLGAYAAIGIVLIISMTYFKRKKK